MRQINRIILHCSATRPNWFSDKTAAEKVDEIRRWHVVDNGWSDIGYHYVIDRDGTVVGGRPVARVGAHVKGHNTGSIGVCLIGGHGSAKTDKFSDNYTDAQNLSLWTLIDSLQERFGALSVHGHNEYANKACPGFSVSEWMGHAASLKTEENKTTTKKPRDNVWKSTTIRAQIAQWFAANGAGVLAIWNSTDDVTKYVIGGLMIAGTLAGAWIFKERIRKWVDGDR